MPVVPIEIDCTSKCRSTAHYFDLICVASQSISIPIVLNYICRCGNCGKGHDKYGRTLIQVCSALSDKWPIIDWLLKQKKVDINLKNLESGYTPLHYSVFYGRINNTVNLIKAGANTSLLDHDHMTYVDHVIRDTLIEKSSDLLDIESYEVYTMGENTNGNLGHCQSTAKKCPELIDVFRRDSICITKVSMDKYHTLFLSTNGSVYSCGVGTGGRLGHDSEESILIPKQIMAMETIKVSEQDRCIDIVVTRDCSYFLTEKGCLWSCGLNNYHQLGHPGVTKFLVPTKMQFRQIKDRKVTHVACGRFHVALILDDSQLYTFGLNAGQLGHPKANDSYIQQPLLVTKFNSQSEQIQKLICNDYSIVCYTTKGDIYVLSDYKYRKIVKHALNVKEIVVVGGKLESNGALDEENLDDDFKVFYVQSKKLYLYHERETSNSRVKLCLWTTKQRHSIDRIAAGTNAIVFLTSTGQVYTASLDKLANINKKIEYDVSSNSIYDERLYQYLTPAPIPFLHRCRAITTDRTGRALAALQYHPTTHLNAYPRQPVSSFYQNLLDLLNEAEHTHDILLEINNNQTYPAHKYILSMRSPYFRQLISKEHLDRLAITNGTNTFINPDLFHLILEYIYADRCPWLSLVEKIRIRDKHEYENYLAQLKNIDDDIDDHRYFTRIRQQTTITQGKTRETHGKKSKKKKKTTGNTEPYTNEPYYDRHDSEEELDHGLEQMIELSKLFQLHSLRKRLETIRQSRQRNGNVTDEHVGQAKQRCCYTREALSDLHDVTILAEDGKKISCHKCILISRLDYFRSMFLADWMESQGSSELKMAVPSSLLEIIIDYLYTDNISNKFNVEQLCQILVLADQLLIERLKQICEFHISNLVTFRDAVELLQFSITYNAEQLKMFVQQFICRNMATFLEARLLDNLDDELLTDLAKTYRNLLDCMNYRMITPYNDCPSLEDFWLDIDLLENLPIDIDDNTTALANKKQQSQQKRKQSNKLRTSESEVTSKPLSSTSRSDETNPVVTTPQRLKVFEEEKWTPVSSKKSSKPNKNLQTSNDVAMTNPIRPKMPDAIYSPEEADRLVAVKKAVIPEIIDNNNTSTSPTSPQFNKKTPWKTNIASSPIPFKTIQSMDRETSLPKGTPTRSTPATPSSQAVPILQASSPQYDSTIPWSIVAKSPTSMPHPNIFTAASSPPPPPMSFKDIQNEEVRAHEALRQISNKSLEKIQTEELAIQALHRLYKTDQEFDMLITVERVLPQIANPIWPRTTSTTTVSSSPNLTLVTQKKGLK